MKGAFLFEESPLNFWELLFLYSYPHQNHDHPDEAIIIQ